MLKILVFFIDWEGFPHGSAGTNLFEEVAGQSEDVEKGGISE